MEHLALGVCGALKIRDMRNTLQFDVRLIEQLKLRRNVHAICNLIKKYYGVKVPKFSFFKKIINFFKNNYKLFFVPKKKSIEKDNLKLGCQDREVRS